MIKLCSARYMNQEESADTFSYNTKPTDPYDQSPDTKTQRLNPDPEHRGNMHIPCPCPISALNGTRWDQDWKKKYIIFPNIYRRSIYLTLIRFFIYIFFFLFLFSINPCLFPHIYIYFSLMRPFPFNKLDQS